jgi:signal transduction histidine kinase
MPSAPLREFCCAVVGRDRKIACGISHTGVCDRAAGAEAIAMKLLETSRNLLFRPDGTWTLRWVTLLSFLATGALLFAWDWIEHTFLSGASGIALHRMHIVRGISTGVLVSVGITSLLLRNRIRHEQNTKELNRKLVRQERLAAVGELVGGIAHELSNPLAGIGGALAVVAREIPQDDETRETMEEIQQQVRRMESLILDLRAYARPGQLNPEWVDVRSILQQAAESVSQLPGVPGADLVLDLDPQVPEIYADPREFKYAFENLIRNAYQAIAEGGKIEVRTQRVRDRVHVSVRDDGVGIEADVRNRIFEPFFTTKTRGTGLGLSLVQRAVENHGGEIAVHSTPGKGATFELIFSTEQSPV